jgi:CDP-diacylglycerol--serine O-phosphatidyltransferase
MLSIPPVRYLLPNLFTLAATLCGFGVLVVATSGPSANELYWACLLFPLACVLDGFDGRVARWVHGESEFGVQFDSLSDFSTFGIAPAALIYTWALRPLGPLGLLIAFLFAAAAMTRLARFNVASAEEGTSGRFFTGLPAPMGGMCIAALVSLETGILHRSESSAAALPAIAVLVVLVAVLMVSNVRFRTFKDMRMTPANRVLLGSILVAFTVLAVSFNLMFAFSVALVGYLATGLFGSLLTLGRPVGFDHGAAILDEDEFYDDPPEDDDDHV